MGTRFPHEAHSDRPRGLRLSVRHQMWFKCTWAGNCTWIRLSHYLGRLKRISIHSKRLYLWGTLLDSVQRLRFQKSGRNKLLHGCMKLILISIAILKLLLLFYLSWCEWNNDLFILFRALTLNNNRNWSISGRIIVQVSSTSELLKVVLRR